MVFRMPARCRSGLRNVMHRTAATRATEAAAAAAGDLGKRASWCVRDVATDIKTLWTAIYRHFTTGVHIHSP